MNAHIASTSPGQSSADTIAAIQSLLSEGKRRQEIAEILGIPPRTLTRIRAQMKSGTTPTPAVEPSAPAPKSPKPTKIKIATPQPTSDDIRERIATDELTVPFSNWLGDGWYREAGQPQDIYETDENGEQQLVGVKVDPGVLWPDEWNGPKTVEDIWISPNVPAPKRSLKRGFITTSAQSLTPAHGPFVINLHALAAARGLEFSDIGGFTYGKSVFAKRRKKDLLEVAPWSAMIVDKVCRDRRHLHSTVQACFEMNMRPTKQNPLVGLTDYVRGKTSIFAHPKRAVESVPRPRSYDPVMMWTTGCCTVPNYVTQEAGLKSLQEHQIGALIIEIDMDDNVFIRTIDADRETGNLHDLEPLGFRMLSAISEAIGLRVNLQVAA
ncbi:helix-turn-helix domain-containing protein [Rhizobium terrae]|uniref:helix-turn-helix domain-containing protein n=1 Tax=Rhizobium terrae TaxID=2171756 RepID=UPI000E3C6BEF|nr:helix-turn-helix domain-containing protein [Rhizobium terrae]